jgi:sorbitol-6-phosphate 2-dehydrogenase
MSAVGKLENQVAIVTGGGQGLGEGLARRLDREGCRVMVADLNFDNAQKVARSLKSAVPFKVDVSDEAQVEGMVDCAIRSFGALDILVSNAGILIAKSILEFPPREWKKMMDVNLYGYFLSAKFAAMEMARNKKGCIIQINSKSGKKGSYKNSAYSATKFGGIGLTQSLALDLAEYNIRVNAICPGNLMDSPLWVNSLFDQYSKNQGLTVEEVKQKYINQVPLKRYCTYEDVANVMVFLASEDSSYMTGQAINVTGGQEMR